MPQGPFNSLVGKIVGLTSYSWLSLGKQNDLLNSRLRGDKYTPAYQGSMFWAANQAGATLSNALATTYVGLCLSNPAASTKNLSVRKVTGAFVVAPGAVGALGLISGWSAAGVVTHTTPLTVQNSKLAGSAVAQGLADAACTIVGAGANAPSWNRFLAVSKVSAELANFNEEVEGGIIIPPGGYLAVGSFGAAGPGSGFVGSIEWDEIVP